MDFNNYFLELLASSNLGIFFIGYCLVAMTLLFTFLRIGHPWIGLIAGAPIITLPVIGYGLWENIRLARLCKETIYFCEGSPVGISYVVITPKVFGVLLILFAILWLIYKYGIWRVSPPTPENSIYKQTLIFAPVLGYMAGLILVLIKDIFSANFKRASPVS